jgi:alpha-tubulin suppressor-like RCC1 family protein
MSKVFSFGFGGFGALSLRETAMRNQPTPELSDTLTDIRVEKIACGLWHALIISDDNSLFSVGRYGALGLGDAHTQDEFNSLQPRLVPRFSPENNIRIIDCAAGRTHSLAVSEDGRIFSFGFGNGCGHGSAALDSNPHEINSLANYQIVQCSAGAHLSACLDAKGKVFVWGNQIRRPYLLKHSVLQTEKVTNVVCGEKHVMMLTESGRLFGTGDNRDSQVNPSSETSVLDEMSQIVEIECPNSNDSWKEVHCGLKQTVGVTKKGRIYIWGWLRKDTFHIDGHLKKLEEIPLPDLHGSAVKQVFCGYSSVGILTDAGECYHLGFNIHGNLGLGDYQHRKSFERITALDTIFVTKMFYGCYNGYAIAGSSILQDFENMLRRGTGANLTIKAEYIEYQVHKNILVARSPVLNEMIRSLPDDASVLSVSELIPDELLSHVLDYIYTNVSIGVPQAVEQELKEIITDKLQMGKVSIGHGKLSSHPTEYHNAIQRIFEDRDNLFPDVTFRLDDGSIVYAHKGILSTRSDYFKGMFSHGMIESLQDEITFSQTSSNAFLELLNFLYTGKENATPESSVELYELATRVNCSRWIPKLESIIISNIDETTCVDLLLVAETYSCPSIRYVCMKMIAENYKTNSKLAERVQQELANPETLQLIQECIELSERTDLNQMELEQMDLDWMNDQAVMDDNVARSDGRQSLAGVSQNDNNAVNTILGQKGCSVM